MPRSSSLVLLALFVLAGCSRGGPAQKSFAMPDVVVAEQEKPEAPSAQIFSYSHVIALAMDHDAVRARYDGAREACLHDAALHCKLLSANIDEHPDLASASLTLAMPHDSIAGFEAALQKPLPQDKDGVQLNARSTRAESVENQKSDTDKKAAQLSKYRDGLAELAKRPNLSVDDYIKVQQELSKTEADLDEALAAQRDVAGRIARESLSVMLVERGRAAASPIGEAWNEAGELFVDSTAQVLRFVIQLVPWLPVALGLFFLLRWIWRIARRTPAVAKSPPANTGG